MQLQYQDLRRFSGLVDSPLPAICSTEDSTRFESSPTPPLRIVNMVSTVDLGCQFDLRHIARSAQNTEYKPDKFSGLIMRIREPRATGLIFSSGKVVVLGANNEIEARGAALKLAQICKRLGYAPTFRNFKLQNIVATSRINRRINLDLLQVQHSQWSTYDPEVFPGLIYKMAMPAVTCLIFTSGNSASHFVLSFFAAVCAVSCISVVKSFELVAFSM